MSVIDDDDSIAQGQLAEMLAGPPKPPSRIDVAMAERHKQALAQILICLTSRNADHWFDLPIELRPHLSENEMAMIGRAMLKALPIDVSANVMESVLAGTALDGPLPDLESNRIEAREWARHANLAEIKNFLREGVKRLPRSDKARFKVWLKDHG